MPGKNPGVMTAMFVAVGGWLIYDMATAREAQSAAGGTLHYIFLAGIAVGLVGTALSLKRS
ncbi:MAG TPA: hypothetical protein VFI98_07165 [Pseudolabrys sp.]|jgi:hypothetical protein|nr:hypothetical protein [Pseudolabrys sp.]